MSIISRKAATLSKNRTPQMKKMSRWLRQELRRGNERRWDSLENTTERYVILSGCGAVEVGTAEPCDITTGAVVIISASICKHIKNTGENGLLFLAICSPRFQKKTTARDQFEPRMGTIERPLQFSFIAEKFLTAKGLPVNCA